MAVEIQLINQIEQHEFLYNFNLPQYNRKDMVEEAWANIAANTNMTISDCKEKWRNIRSSFLRSMKPSGIKVKKPYYLTEYLKFILPFLKPTTTGIEGTDDSQYESPQHTTEDIVADFIKEEPVDGDAEDTIENNGDNVTLSDLLTPRPPILRKRRRLVPTRKNCIDPLRNKSKTVTSAFQRNITTQPDLSTNNNNSAMRMFLMSLLPELETMTEDQIRLFKIKSMMLIDEIKVNYSQVRQSASTINNERLQKRLINLLLKNLQRATKDNGKTK